MSIDVSSHLFKLDGRNDAHRQRLHDSRCTLSKEFVLEIERQNASQRHILIKLIKISLRALMHQTDVKERRAATKAGCYVASLRLSVDFMAP